MSAERRVRVGGESAPELRIKNLQLSPRPGRASAAGDQLAGEGHPLGASQNLSGAFQLEFHFGCRWVDHDHSTEDLGGVLYLNLPAPGTATGDDQTLELKSPPDFQLRLRRSPLDDEDSLPDPGAVNGRFQTVREIDHRDLRTPRRSAVGRETSREGRAADDGLSGHGGELVDQGRQG